MAVTADRAAPSRDGRRFTYPVASGAVLYGGTLVMINTSGEAVVPSAVNTLVPVGVAVNPRAMNGTTVEVETGVFLFKNSSAGDAIAAADYGDVCYAVDNDTVAKTSNSNARSPAGIVRAVDARGVWVEVGRRY